MAKERTASRSGFFIFNNSDKHLKVTGYLSGWTDQRYKRYGLAKDEINILEPKNRPIETNDE